jgi:type I restriction enzyme S subunit
MVKEGYKETIVGPIPEEWNFNPLKEVCKFKNGKSTDYYSNLEEGKYYIYGSNGPIGSLNESNFEKGYIVGRVGAVGEIHYIDKPVWVSDNAIQVSIKKNKKVDRRYLFYWLKRRDLGQFSTKSAQPLLNQSTIKTIPIPFPPLPEQEKIASILSSVDKSIEKTDEVIEDTKELKKGLMQELLTRGIGHSEFKEVRIGVKKYDIPKNWAVKKLEKCCKISYGKDQSDVEVENGDYPILGTGGLIGYANDYLYDKSSVLIGRKGTIDKPQYMETPFWTIDTLFYTNDFNETYPKWLYYYLNYYDLSLLNEATGVPSLNRNNLYNLDLPYPPLEEQKKIASILSSVDAKIKKEEEYKAKLEQLKKGLMQKLLTGEIRVNTEMEV